MNLVHVKIERDSHLIKYIPFIREFNPSISIAQLKDNIEKEKIAFYFDLDYFDLVEELEERDKKIEFRNLLTDLVNHGANIHLYLQTEPNEEPEFIPLEVLDNWLLTMQETQRQQEWEVNSNKGGEKRAMAEIEYTDFIKKCFETFYEKLRKNSPEALKLESKRVHNLSPDDSGVPLEMEYGRVSKDGLVMWKLVPSCTTQEDLEQLEAYFGVKFPLVFRAFLSTYYHLFGYLSTEICNQPSDHPFSDFLDMYHPILLKFNFLPFAWDKSYTFIRCIDLNFMPDEENCPVCEIDHEYLFSLTSEAATKRQLDDHFYKVNKNFYELLEETFLKID